MKVLLVDDEVLTVETLERTIPWQEYGVTQIQKAFSLRQAQQVCEEDLPDIIFCDIEMPKGSGIDFAEWLGERELEVVLIFLTSHAVFSYAQKAVKLGAMDYLLKPIGKKDVCKVLEKSIETAKVNRRHRETEEIITRRKAEAVRFDSSVRKVKDYIEAHYREPLTREELSSMAFLNPDYFSKVFKKQTGYALMDYVTKERIEAAKRLLKKSSLTISEIALETGYSNTAYFTKIFKKYLNGMTPTQYRRISGDQ